MVRARPSQQPFGGAEGGASDQPITGTGCANGDQPQYLGIQLDQRRNFLLENGEGVGNSLLREVESFPGLVTLG